MSKHGPYIVDLPAIMIDVHEAGRKPRRGRIGFDLGREFHFSTSSIESFMVSPWHSIIDDALVVAASIEFADRLVSRPAHGWARRFSLRIPVYNFDRWADTPTFDALIDAISFLTGDHWSIDFTQRRTDPKTRPDAYLELPGETEAVLAYSDGMDSRAVASLLRTQFGNRLIPVRLGNNGNIRHRNNKILFTGIPYSICTNKRLREPSARSRGFKFSLISGIAALLSNASTIVIPESGQGVFGPAIASVGHSYPDYRNHPQFSSRMQRFINSLFNTSSQFSFPRLWSIKGETLASFISHDPQAQWQDTRSCWMTRWVSVNKKRRQCGVCAACLLRRMSVYAAGLTEPSETYIWNKIRASTFEKAMDPDFAFYNRRFKEYAIAGVLHLDHLADLAHDQSSAIISRHACLIAPGLNLSPNEVQTNLHSLLMRHATEWSNFLGHLGPGSFLNKIVRGNQ